MNWNQITGYNSIYSNRDTTRVSMIRTKERIETQNQNFNIVGDFELGPVGYPNVCLTDPCRAQHHDGPCTQSRCSHSAQFAYVHVRVIATRSRAHEKTWRRASGALRTTSERAPGFS